MIPHLFFYQLALIALVWLFLMLPYAWLCQRTPCQSPPTPPTPPRKRPREPKVCAGLTHKPHCAACDQVATHPTPPPPERPAPMPLSTWRPRRVDTSLHCCPHAGCAYCGWLGLGNLRANGHPSGGPWRQCHCTACEGDFLETHGTILHGTRVPVDLIVGALACLAEGRGIRATARVVEGDPNTVLSWLVEAAEQRRACAAYFLCNLHVKQLQLDELDAVLRDRKAGESSDDEALKRLDRACGSR
jgi:transposase-like protein